MVIVGPITQTNRQHTSVVAMLAKGYNGKLLTLALLVQRNDSMIISLVRGNQEMIGQQTRQDEDNQSDTIIKYNGRSITDRRLIS